MNIYIYNTLSVKCSYHTLRKWFNSEFVSDVLSFWSENITLWKTSTPPGLAWRKDFQHTPETYSVVCAVFIRYSLMTDIWENCIKAAFLFSFFFWMNVMLKKKQRLDVLHTCFIKVSKRLQAENSLPCDIKWVPQTVLLKHLISNGGGKQKLHFKRFSSVSFFTVRPLTQHLWLRYLFRLWLEYFFKLPQKVRKVINLVLCASTEVVRRLSLSLSLSLCLSLSLNTVRLYSNGQINASAIKHSGFRVLPLFHINGNKDDSNTLSGVHMSLFLFFIERHKDRRTLTFK